MKVDNIRNFASGVHQFPYTHAFGNTGVIDSPQWQSCSGLCYPCAKLVIFKNCLMWSPSYLPLCTPKPLPSVLPSSPFLHQSFQPPTGARNAHIFWVIPSQFWEKVILISWKLNTFLCKESKTSRMQTPLRNFLQAHIHTLGIKLIDCSQTPPTSSAVKIFSKFFSPAYRKHFH